MRWYEDNREAYDEFCALGNKLQLFKQVKVAIFRQEGGDPESREIAALSFDGVNAGLLSDGTLRAIEILYNLLALKPGSLLLVEEPETAVHPGMLARLLNIIESYTQDRQLVFSTHSPEVVSRARAGQLRLVQRFEGKTTLRRLTGDEAKRVQQYLCDEGTLGEFVFSGGVDGDP
jgi:predicted ATPase